MAFYTEKPKTIISVPTSSSILTVDTRDGLTYDSNGYPNYKNPYDIDIYKNSPIFRGKINRIALTNFSMKYTSPNVNPYNNVLFLEREGVPGQAPEIYGLFKDTDHLVGLTLEEIKGLSALSPGFYSPDYLAGKIKGILNAGDGVFGIKTWDCYYISSQNEIPPGVIPTYPLSGRFYIGNSSEVAFKINPMLGKDKGYYTPLGSSNNYKRTSTLAQLMGFDYISSGKGYASFWYSGIPSMNYTSYIDVVSNTITKNQFTKDVSTDNNTGYDLLARIYLNDDMKQYTTKNLITGPDSTTVAGYNIDFSYPGSMPMMLNWQASYPKQIRWDKEAFLAGVQIQLRDDMGNLLYYQDEQPTNINLYGDTGYAVMTFMISEEDD